MNSSATTPGAGVPAKIRIGGFILALLIPLFGFIAGGKYVRSANPEMRQVGRSWVLAAGIGLFPWLLYFCMFNYTGPTA